MHQPFGQRRPPMGRRLERSPTELDIFSEELREVSNVEIRPSLTKRLKPLEEEGLSQHHNCMLAHRPFEAHLEQALGFDSKLHGQVLHYLAYKAVYKQRHCLFFAKATLPGIEQLIL